MALTKIWQKLDLEGEFLFFPGVTIINKVHVDEWERFRELLVQIDKIAGEWVAVLPVESLHVTLMAGATAKCMNLNPEAEEAAMLSAERSWLQSRARKFEKAHELVVEDAFSPQSFVPHRARFSTGVKFDVVAQDTEEERRGFQLRARIREWCNPKPSCCFEERERPWHLSLAYARPVAVRTGGIPADIQQRLQDLCRPFLGRPLLLQQSELCRHDDMTEFVPWDGRHLNPGEWQPYVSGHRQAALLGAQRRIDTEVPKRQQAAERYDAKVPKRWGRRPEPLPSTSAAGELSSEGPTDKSFAGCAEQIANSSCTESANKT